MKILLDFLFLFVSSILIILFYNQNANGSYVPKIYGSVDPQKCLFITENGEEHQIYRHGNVFIFGRVYLLDAKNAKMLKNANCQDVEIVENAKMNGEQLQFQQVLIQGNNHSNQITTLAKDEDGICRVKNTRGLDYPIYSCQSLMMSAQQKQKVEENLCSSDEFFYLEEIMEKNGLTRQKVVLLKVPTGLLVKFMAFPGPEIDPIGLSEFVEAKTFMKWLKGGIQWRGWHWNKTDMKESEVLEKKLENATPQEGTKKNLGWGKMEKMMAGKKMLLYHGLSFIVKYFSCNKINFTNNNNNNDDDDDSSLKFLKAGFQMKLICEDIKGFLVQITKGHLEDGQLSIGDLGKKMARTVDTLKWSHGLALGTAATEGKLQQQDGMEKSKLVDVFKHIQQIVTRKLPMFKRNNNNSSTMGKELKPFAGTLLYLMEKMQKNLRKLDSSNGILQNRRKKRGAKMEMWKDFWKCVGNILLCIFIILLFTVIFLALAFPPVLAVILACIFMVIGWVCSRGGGCYVVVM